MLDRVETKIYKSILKDVTMLCFFIYKMIKWEQKDFICSNYK